jgi:hypothetical protein
MRDRIGTGPSHRLRSTRSPRTVRHALVVSAGALATALATIVGLGAPSAAMAGLQHEFEVFANCPVNAPKVTACVVSNVTGGEFVLGKKQVAITKPVVLQGGEDEGVLVPATNGETLSRTALTVPGGLHGVEGLGGEVTATAELAGTVKLNVEGLVFGKGTAVSLPLKVKLDNPVLGPECLVGSEREPIAVNLTSGTTSPPAPNEPISGIRGHLGFIADGRIEQVSGSSLVDNSFAVGAANGCGGLLFLLVDPTVDLSAGVPASAGHNTAILDGTLEQASAREVRGQLALPEIGRCVVAESTGEGKGKVFKGEFEDKGCTEEDGFGEGKYEWLAGPGAKRHFVGTGGKTTLEGATGAKVTCTKTSTAGEYTGVKTASAVITLTGCVHAGTKQPCQSSGASSGEIVTGDLTGKLGFISDEVSASASNVSIGLDISGQPSLLSAECGEQKEALAVRGSVIAPIGKLDKMSSSFTAKFTAKAGAQVPEAFEEAPKDTLTATLGFGEEQAGLTSSQKLTSEEPMEIKALHSS